MSKPFEAFRVELNQLQLSLLVDTVSYFEDAPKLLSLPSLAGETVSVPLSIDTLRRMEASFAEGEQLEKGQFGFDWQEETEHTGVLAITLPNGETIRQATDLRKFSLL